MHMENLIWVSVLLGASALWNSWILMKEIRRLRHDLKWMYELKIMEGSNSVIKDEWEMPERIVCIGELRLKNSD